MKPFSLELAKVPGTEFCTRNGFKAEILSFNSKKGYYSAYCKRPIEYKVFYNDGTTEIMYCDINDKCNSNVFRAIDMTHDLMIKD